MTLSETARGRMVEARARCRPRRPRPERAHLRREHGFRALRLADDPGGADRGAAAATAAKPCLRGRRAVSGRDRPRGDGAPGQRAREGALRRSARARRAAARLSRPRGAARRAEPRLGGCERRPRTTRASRSAARRRGRGLVRRRPAPRPRGARTRWAPAGNPSGEGGAVTRERHPVHGRVRGARARSRAAARQDGRHRLRGVARGAAGVANELYPTGARVAPAARPAGLGGERPGAARGFGDQRGAPLVRQGAGRLLAALRAAGARGHPRPARLRRLHGLGRAERGDRQPTRARRGRPPRLQRQLPRPAARVCARCAGARGRRTGEHLGAPRGAARQPEPVGRVCRRS